MKKIKSIKMNKELENRIKGFLWGMFNVVWISAILAVLNYIIEVVPTFGLSEFLTMTIIMVATQGTKYLNKKKGNK